MKSSLLRLPGTLTTLTIQYFHVRAGYYCIDFLTMPGHIVVF